MCSRREPAAAAGVRMRARALCVARRLEYNGARTNSRARRDASPARRDRADPFGQQGGSPSPPVGSPRLGIRTWFPTQRSSAPAPRRGSRARFGPPPAEVLAPLGGRPPSCGARLGRRSLSHRTAPACCPPPGAMQSGPPGGWSLTAFFGARKCSSRGGGRRGAGRGRARARARGAAQGCLTTAAGGAETFGLKMGAFRRAPREGSGFPLFHNMHMHM